ncbi:MAG: ribonuclease H-like YkuK family protein [bacterium]|nr:ribonuclease H-like YkuK family protein [bacterium]MDZ4341709.1 ribonuclease H-like YkuK family protein [Candidatus Binatia bacterium]
MSPIINFLKFHNPSQGELLFGQVLKEIVDFMKADRQAKYRVMIGSDSNGHGSLDVVSVVAIHRVGNGGRYFWHRTAKAGIKTLRQKIYAEVEMSLELAALFLPAFRKELGRVINQTELPFDFQIHVDVGEMGETRDLIREVTSMVRGYGYEVFVKPDSAAATSFADRHVR